MNSDYCEHEIFNDCCRKCGLMMEQKFETDRDQETYYNTNEKINKMDELNSIPFEVTQKAKNNMLMKKNHTGKKVRNDAKNTFIQLYIAYLECGIAPKPLILTKQLKLKKKEVNDCMKEINQTSLIQRDEYKNINNIVCFNPIGYVRDYCLNNDITDEQHINNIEKFMNNVLNNNDIFLTYPPETFALSLIKYYCDYKKIVIKNFSKNNNTSDNAIKKIIEDIKHFK